MSRFYFASACALVALATASTAHAQYQTQQDYVIRGMSNGSYYGGGGGYGRVVYPSAFAPTAAPDYSSYYAPAYVPPRDAALIDLHVPANAQVWFSGDKTTQTGTDRSYVTPSLERDRKYAFQIKVTWTDAKGQRVEREKKVAIQPGARLNLEFE